MTMRRLFIPAALLAAALAISGCGAGTALDNAVMSVTATPANQANQVAITENAYTAAGHATLLYLNSGRADPVVAAEIARLDNIAHDALVAARRAVANGNNALVAAALDAFTRRTGDLRSYLISKGIAL